VCAATVILPTDCVIEGLNDSKKLSEKKRDALYDIIKEQAVSYSIAFASVEEIEEHNILQATFLAMTRAVEGLSVPADFVLIDGNKIPPQLTVPAKFVIGGDALSASIAAASVLAKVTRDRYMLEMDEQYPQYNFKKHKGYGTKDHREALLTFGPSPIHRMSFLKKILK
jgi:ribonuclease HII